MLRKKQVSLLIILFLTSLSLIQISIDFAISKVDSNRTNTDIEIINSIETEAIHDNNDIFSKNSESKTWTYMLYLDADNDIEGDAIRDFEWLEEAGGSNENISIIVLLDRIPGYDNTHGNWNGSRIYNITADISPFTIDSQLLVDLGEVDMANPTTLTNFITYCFDNFPADNYILDLWNHGHAAYGVIDDETSSSHFIVNDVQTAINDALDSSSEEIDIISMDACNMATLEVAWEMRNLSKYFISSEDGTNGYPYKLITERLKLNPSINASAFCELMVDAYSDHYMNFYLTCISVINQTKLLDLPDVLNTFILDLIDTLEKGNYNDVFAFVRELSYDFYDENWVDFISLIDNILLFLDNQELTLAAEEFLEFLNQIVPYNWQNIGYKGNARGVTIYMPFGPATSEFIYDYINGLSFCLGMDWQDDTLWDEFLVYYVQNYYHIIHEPQLLTLDEVLEGCSIQLNSTKLYRINLWQNAIYEFSCSISSGDVDFRIFEFDFSSKCEFIGGSYLYNPEDGTIETCRFRLETGFYLIIVKSKNMSAIYDLEASKYDSIELVCNLPYTSGGGSLNGDSQGHYMQDLNHYFQIALPYGNNKITLINSETSNYQLSIYNEFWQTLYFLPAIGLGEILTFIYNQTSSEPIILILKICGYEGVGEFTIEIKNPLEPTPKMTANIWFFFVFIPIISVCSRRKNKRRN